MSEAEQKADPEETGADAAQGSAVAARRPRDADRAAGSGDKAVKVVARKSAQNVAVVAEDAPPSGAKEPEKKPGQGKQAAQKQGSGKPGQNKAAAERGQPGKATGGKGAENKASSAAGDAKAAPAGDAKAAAPAAKAGDTKKK